MNPILFVVAMTAFGAGMVNLSAAFLAQNMSDSFREDQLMGYGRTREPDLHSVLELVRGAARR